MGPAPDLIESVVGVRPRGANCCFVVHVASISQPVPQRQYARPLQTEEIALAPLASKLNARAPFTVRQFRDASGVGRNVVIEVLEYFDGRGFTQRIGDTRRVVGDLSQIAATQG